MSFLYIWQITPQGKINVVVFIFRHPGFMLSHILLFWRAGFLNKKLTPYLHATNPISAEKFFLL